VSINPTSDIVLDVARAADPVKCRAAVENLSPGEIADPASITGFDHVLVETVQTYQAKRLSFIGNGATTPEIPPQVDARMKAYRGLEQLVLENLVENMLPKESGAFFGTGTAGEIWRSFLADQLAAQVGKVVDLGIAHHQPMVGSNSLETRQPVPNRGR